ncbi:CobW/HypB/UreG, nucleotide-binding domain-containing protein [Dipodascopsis uninucleata]
MIIEPTPITVLTGFLGAGKTTLMISLLKQLPDNYRVAVLKNEYGDVKIDSILASETSRNLAGVSEMLNGCLCCVLTGQMREAILEIQNKYNPDRIIVETSGSAFPATISIQLRDLAKEFKQAGVGRGIRLDGVINIIDVENFTGYADTSMTAKMQAQYTDLIVLNKWEQVNERRYDLVLDRVNDLNTDTPKIKSDHGYIPFEAIIGLDSKLAVASKIDCCHDHSHMSVDGHDHFNKEEHLSEIETLTVSISKSEFSDGLELAGLFKFIDTAPKDEIYRIKFIIQAPTQVLPDFPAKASMITNGPVKVIFNWAFGRYEFIQVSDNNAAIIIDESLFAIGTIMVGQGDGRRWKKRLTTGPLALGPMASVDLN